MQICKESFHNKHEAYTEKAYNTPGMLPYRYVFILTNLCNLKCDFCYQAKKKRLSDMDKDDWINLMKQLPEEARVTLTGGEPLIFNGFNEVFIYAAKHFDCNIITNGTLLTKELIDLMLSFPRFRVLSISIDNIGNTLRGINPNLWKHTECMMRYFIQKRDEVNSEAILDAKTMILDSNAADLLNIHQYCVEELGCDNHSLQFLKGSPMQHADEMFDFEDMIKKSQAYVYTEFVIINKQLEEIRSYNLKNSKSAFLHPKIASLVSERTLPPIDYINNAAYNHKLFEPCKFPWSSVHINSDGNLFPCLAASIGNIKEFSLQNIINGKLSTYFREIIRENSTVEACNRCGWLRPKQPAEVNNG